MDLDLQKLCEEVEDCYPRDKAGEEVFSSWAEQRWSERDYACPGFAFKYTSNKFVARAEATHELLEVASRKYAFDLTNAEIFDFGAGPGCAAAGAAKFLLQKGIEPQVTFFEPLQEWEPATAAFLRMGITAEFDMCPSLQQMVVSLKHRLLRSSGPFVVCISHVLQDFGGSKQELADWWIGLQQASSGRRFIVLILERSKCEPFLPERLPGGGLLFAPGEKLPSGTDNNSFCAAVFLPMASVQELRPGSSAQRPECQIEGNAARRPAMLPAAPTATPQFRSPSCPECHSPMVKRTNRNGYNPGSQFWGCTQWPACKGKRRV